MFCASLVSAVFGMGTALIVLSVGALILPVKEVVALSAILFLASTLTKALIYRVEIPWRDALVMSLVSLPFAWLGGLGMSFLPAELLRKLLGVMVLGWLFHSAFAGRGSAVRPGTSVLVMGAGVYGFVSGLLGSGNLVKAILFRGMALEGAAFVGIMAATSVLANVGKLTAYVQNGMLTPAYWPMVLMLITVAIAAALVGKYLLKRTPPNWFHTGLNIVMAISALLLLI